MNSVQIQKPCLEVYDSKYRLKDDFGNAIDSSIDDTFRRVAKELASSEHPDRRQEWEDKFFWAMKNGAIPAGRILSNAGSKAYKPGTSAINCTVSCTIEDSIEGIGEAVKQAGITLSTGAGIGYEFSSLRPKGAFVRGVGAKTSGPLPFMDVFDKMCFTISSAGGRRGAQMATFDVRHPDIFDFIKSKREDGRFRQFNISVLISKNFIEALEKDSNWNLIFPIRVAEKDFYKQDKLVWDFWSNKDSDYIYDQVGRVQCLIYNTVKARDLWNTIMASSYNYSEPGIILIDEMNLKNNNWFCENLRATNPCVTGDTLLLTRQGYKSIQSLVGHTLDIWNGYEWSVVTPTITGVDQDIMRLEFSDGSDLKCTPYHKFVLADETRVEAKDLKIDDKLVKFGFPVIKGEKELGTKEAYTSGFYCGDGSEGLNEIWLYGKKLELLQFLDFKSFWFDETVGNRGVARLSTEFRDKNFVPDTSYTVQSRLDWLAGLLDSDGSLNSKDGALSITSVNRKFLLDVKYMVQTLGQSVVLSLGGDGGQKPLPDGKGGFKDYETQPWFRLVIRASSVKILRELGLKTHRVDCNIADPDRDASRFLKIVKIEQLEKEDLVYCFTESKRHMGVFNCVATAQCGEQALPPHGACLLGSVNLTAFISNPFTAEASFDWDRYRSVVRIFTRLLDNVVEINGLPLPEQDFEIRNKRRHGMGIIGLGSALVMLGVTYGTKESLELCERFCKEMALEGWKEALVLAKEKGPAPITRQYFRVTKEMLAKRPEIGEDGYQEGDSIKGSILLVRYSDYMRALHEELPRDFWVELEKIGPRFTHHSSIAPTGTISVAMCNNVSNGIEPSFSHEYTRNVTKEGHNTRVPVTMYSYEMLLYREIFGSSAKLPSYFVESDSVPWRDHIAMQCAAQKWVDSSISKTVNMPTDISFEEFKDVYKLAIELGAKGCTTFRFNPEAFTGILVRKEDLKNTNYKIILEDGSELVLTGDQNVRYDGQIQNVANLFAEIKDGTYGKW